MPGSADRAQPLYCGDYIYLSCTDGSDNGFLAADGFISEDAKCLKTLPRSADREDLLFEICSPLDYEQRRHLDAGGGGSLQEVTESDPRQDSRVAESEQNAASKQLKRGQNYPLLYGNKIQLQHVRSSKYLTLDGSHTAEEDAECMRISLGTGSKAAFFQLVGLYKIQADGSPVCDGSEVMICNCMLGDHFLHTNLAARAHAREVNLSIKQSAWGLHLYHAFTPNQSDYLMLRQPVLLFQTEEESFVLCDESSSVSLCDESSNLNTHFEFESTNDERIEGGMMRWCTEYRLRHVASKKYLARCGSETVKRQDSAFPLTDGFSEQESDSPLPPGKKQGNVRAKFTLVEDVSTGGAFMVFPAELSGTPDEEFVSLLDARVNGCRIACVGDREQFWLHKAEGNSIQLCTHKLAEDALRILPAEGDDTPDVKYTLSCVLGTMSYMRAAGASSDGIADEINVRSFNCLLESIMGKLKQSNSRCGRIQDIFRSLKLLDALMWALQAPFLVGGKAMLSPMTALPTVLHTTQVAVINALKAIILNNVDNQIYVARKVMRLRVTTSNIEDYCS
jgi:hypothetical protein